MNPYPLLKATIAAHKRELRGPSLAALLMVVDGPVELGKVAKEIGISTAAMTGLTDNLYLKGYATRRSVEAISRIINRKAWQHT